MPQSAPEQSYERFYGEPLEGTLLHAAEKTAYIRELRNTSYEQIERNPGWKDLAKEQEIPVRIWMKNEAHRQEEKLISISRPIDILIERGIELDVFSLDRERLEASGRLVRVDLAKSAMTLLHFEAGVQLIPFAEALEVPAHFRQSYYGHKMSVSLDLIGHDKDVAKWIFGY